MAAAIETLTVKATREFEDSRNIFVFEKEPMTVVSSPNILLGG
jgi:hypothetical protein